MGDVEVRRASAADLAALVAVLGQRHFFTDRLARQQDGRGVLLVAWLDGRPAGDVFLDRGPADLPEVRRHLPGVPMLDHLEVLERLQRRGIGTALVRAGEDTARRLGHRRLALGVGVDNPGARRLYERLGYADWGHGTIVGTWVDRDRDGPPATVSERLHLLVKPLPGHGPAAGLPSGTVHPILARLETVGWLESRWEEIDPRVEGRPARRYYRLTSDGMELARTALARAYTSARPAWLRPVGEEP